MDALIKEGETMSFNGKTYEFGKKLGEGGFGQISYYSQYVAIKIVDKRQLNNPEDANREIQNIKSLDHPNIIKLYDAMEIWGKNGENSIYLFMEYAYDEDLHNFIKNNIINENDAKFLFYQVVSGVVYLHSKGIAHRDLKPKNILLHCLDIKIADFGLSKKFEQDDEMLSRCGTPKYAAPEVFDQNIPIYNGCKADIFSLGMVLKDLVTKYGKKQRTLNFI